MASWTAMNDTSPSRAQAQLRLIGEVVRVVAAGDLGCWLFGGWGRWVWDLAEHKIDDNVGTEPAGLTALWVAENLQERVIETRLNTWPACPEHSHHPLWLSSPLDFDAAWTCPASGRPIARLGTLGELDQP
jgi:hypothetical protein